MCVDGITKVTFGGRHRPVQRVLAERVEGQVDEVAVGGHGQQQHGQLQLGVEAQEHRAGHHGDDPAQHKELSEGGRGLGWKEGGREEKREEGEERGTWERFTNT